DEDDPRFSRPRDLDLIQSVPQADLLNMKAPPRVLTLSEQPLDSLETEETRTQNNQQVTAQTMALFNLHSLYLSQSFFTDYLSLTLKKWKSVFCVSLSASPSPCAPPMRPCPPLSSPEDANVNLFTAAGFLSYVQSTTRRAYQQVLELIDDNQRRTPHDLALDFHEESSLVDASSLRRQ
ncbi:hypothetical protein NL108_009570, partial [Boleophthalmus pectinirostris]